MSKRAGTPDIVVVGHVTTDVADGGWRLGGTATYASLVAARLGLRVGVLTRCQAGLDLGTLGREAEVHVLPDERTTAFENRYRGGVREQYVRAAAGGIGPDDVPEAWRGAGMLLLGPVVGEVAARVMDSFPAAVIGVCGQGWLRQVSPDGEVEPREWDPSALAQKAHALFLSDEDVPWIDSPDALLAWAGPWTVLGWTHGTGGADVYARGAWTHAPAYPAPEVDPTGAGDSFAAAFLIRWVETGDAGAAARFAAVTSSFVVAAEGVGGIPSRAQVEARLRLDPGVLTR